jgi:hypothetical protein
MIQRHSICHACSAVVSDDRESGNTEFGQALNELLCHRALAEAIDVSAGSGPSESPYPGKSAAMTVKCSANRGAT